jgi:PAS domain S-box-containing protein
MDGIPYSKEYLSDPLNWVTYEVRETLCRRAAELTKNDAIMYDIGLSIPKLNPLGGVESMVRLLAGPKTAYNFVPRYARLFDNILQCKVTLNGDNNACVEMSMSGDFLWSQGTCYYAQGILAAIPTVWGLPPAEIHEKKCMCQPDGEHARGGVQYNAEACVFEVNWQSLPSLPDKLRHNIFRRKNRASTDVSTLENNFWLLDQKNAELVENNKQLAIVRDIAINVDKVKTLDEALILAIEKAREIEGVRFAIILKTDESGLNVTIPYHSKIKNLFVANAIKALGFDPDIELGLSSDDKRHPLSLSKFKSIQGYLANPGVTIRPSLAEIADGVLPHALCDAMQKILGVKKLVLVPLLVDGTLWGSMLFFLTQEVPSDILEMIGAHCATAIKNVTALENLEKRNRELSSINAVINATSATLNVPEMLQNAMREVTIALKADAGAIYLPKNDGEELYLAAQVGMPDEIIKKSGTIKGINSAFRKFVLSDEQVRCGDMFDFATEYPEFNSLTSKRNGIPFATTQLRFDAGNRGLMTVARKAGNHFDSSDISILKSIAKQLAIAIEKAILHEDVVAKTEETENARQLSRESDAKSRLIIESVAEGVLVTDLNGVIQGGNRQVVAMHGYYAETEILGLSIFKLLGVSDRVRVIKDLRKVLDIGSSGLLEYTCLKKDGSEFPGELNISLIRDVSGRPTGFVATSRDMTKRQQAERALRESEEKYRSIFDSANDIIIVLGHKGNILDVNDKIVDIGGYEKEELIGHDFRKLAQILTKKSLFLLAVNYAKRLTGIDVPPYEVELYKKNREIINVEITAAPLKINGKIVGDLAILRDITEQKRSVQAFKDSEEKFSKAFQVSPNACSISSLKDGKYVEINDSFSQITGYSKEEVIGSTARILNLWADEKEGEKIRPILRKHGSVTGEEITFRTKSGEIRRGIYSGEIVKLSGEDCVLVTINDITERKRMEIALRESGEKFSKAFSASGNAICITSLSDEHFIEVNESYSRFTGYSREEVIGRTARELGLWVDEKELEGFRSKIKSAGGFQNMEMRSRTKSGEIRVGLASAEIINIGGEPCRIVAITEITERKKMEDELRNAMIKADAANQAKGDFLARMSHEIRTPIHGIMGTLDLLRDTELAQEQRQYLNMARNSADTLLNVINQILDFSKIEAGKIKLENINFNLRKTVEEALSTVAVLAHKKRLEVLLQVSRDIPVKVTGDAVRLQQVLVNLLGNAIKFTEKGEIVLHVGIETEGETEVELHFSIRDTGIGIPKDKEGLLFNPFEQVDGSNSRKYGGTGLGLSICKELVKLMNGRIWFTTKPGEGSVFQFTAKFGKQAVGECNESLPQIPSDLRGLPLLVIDDNATCRSILRDTLKEYGFQVTEADNVSSGLEELEFAKGTSRQFILVLLDKTLPTADVFAAGEQIMLDTAMRPGLVMMLPSDNISSDFAMCQELGISHYLNKPIKESDLIDVILSALGHTKTNKETSKLATPNTVLSKLRILVAEDNITSQLIVKTKLEKAGHSLQIANNGIEAIRMAKEGAFDLILMDFEMPEMNGLEATRLIRKTEQESGQHIPIIAMTAYAMKEDKQKCLDAGMDAYLSKPVKLDELNNVVNDIALKINAKSDVIEIKKANDVSLNNNTKSDVIEIKKANDVSLNNNTKSDVMDIKAALELVEGDEDILKEVIGVFLEQDYPEQLKRLKDGIGQHDAPAVRVAAHCIKGAVRSFGCATFASTALQLEEMGRNDNLTGATEALQKLEEEEKQFSDLFAQYSRQITCKAGKS